MYDATIVDGKRSVTWSQVCAGSRHSRIFDQYRKLKISGGPIVQKSKTIFRAVPWWPRCATLGEMWVSRKSQKKCAAGAQTTALHEHERSVRAPSHCSRPQDAAVVDGG